ncbi:MAG: hypothetical protein HYY18_19725 [Planctomycetes bacterium]|nr:hypothetical protein [Planctomycetota bacterium]
MKRVLALSLALTMALPAFAKRAMRYFDVETLPGTVDTPRLSLFGNGWLVLKKGADGDALVAMGPDGKEARKILELKDAKIDAWWIAPRDTHVAWTSGGRLFVSEIEAFDGRREAPAREDLGATPEGGVAFSSDGRSQAWFVAGTLRVRREGKTKEHALRAGRAFAEGPVFSLDGGAVFAITGPATPAGPADAVESLALDSGTWTALESATGRVLSGLAAPHAEPPDGAYTPEDAGRRVAWIARDADGEADIRVMDAGSKTSETPVEGVAVEAIAFTPYASAIVYTARGDGGRMQAWMVNVFRSGTKRGFARDRIADATDGDIICPTPRGAETWFLAKTCDDAWQVKRAKAR